VSGATFEIGLRPEVEAGAAPRVVVPPLAAPERNLGQLEKSGIPDLGMDSTDTSAIQASGESGTRGEIPLAEILREFREELEVRGYRPGTIVEYLRFTGRFLVCAGSFPSGVTPASCQRFQKEMFYASPQRGGRANYSMSTQSYAIAAVKVFCRWCVRRGYLSWDPSTRVDFPKKKVRLPRTVLTKEEMTRLLSAPEPAFPCGYRDRALLEVLYSTGLRISEAVGLDLLDLDLRERLLLVRDGKGGRDRRVPFSASSAEWIEGYIRVVRPQLDQGLEPKALFLGEKGRRLAGTSVRPVLAAYGKRAGLERRVTPHILRHTCATHLIQEGANLRYVQELLGHGSPETTMVYTHVSVTDLKRVHEKFHPRDRL